MTPGTRGRGPLYGAAEFCWKTWSVSRKFVPEVYWLFIYPHFVGGFLIIGYFCLGSSLVSFQILLLKHWSYIKIMRVTPVKPHETPRNGFGILKNHASTGIKSLLVSEANWSLLTFKPCGVASGHRVPQNSTGWSVPVDRWSQGTLRKLPKNPSKPCQNQATEFHRIAFKRNPEFLNNDQNHTLKHWQCHQNLFNTSLETPDNSKSQQPLKHWQCHSQTDASSRSSR